MIRKISKITTGLVLITGMLFGTLVNAYCENRHWTRERNAHERYKQYLGGMQEGAAEESGNRISGFPILEQFPELPTGCEITAMTMVLNYYGYQVDKMEMALHYLPTVEANFYVNESGMTIGPDMRQYFVGDPTDAGYICGNTAIETAANRFLFDVGSSYYAKALTGVSPELLYQEIDQNAPVVVWVTINMEDREETEGWYLEDGTYMEWSSNDHGAVLIGYDETTVTIADPIYGKVTCSRGHFEQIFQERGSQCVILDC